MNYYQFIQGILIGTISSITLGQFTPAVALDRLEISTEAQQFTVQIDGEETGSGAIIAHNGNSYSVITCWHVVDASGKYQVITSDGEQHQVTEIKHLTGVDLAVLKFSSNKTYEVAKIGDSNTVNTGTAIYLVGYPDPFPGIPQRNYMFLTAEVASRLVKSEDGYEIVHDNPATPGSSGGPLLDDNGYLVGINGKYISEGNTGKAYGLGIPVNLYTGSQTPLSEGSESSLSKSDPAEEFFNLGKTQVEAGDYKEAIAAYDRALQINSHYLDAYHAKAEAHYYLNDYQGIIDDLNQVLWRNPKDIVAYQHRGSAYASLEDHQRAIADYNRAIQINPDYAIAYHRRGYSYFALGEYQLALKDYDRAINLDPTDIDSLNNRGLIYYNQEEYDKANADFTEAIKLDPNYVLAYQNRGLVYRELAETKLAIADWQKAAQLYLKDGKSEEYEKVQELLASPEKSEPETYSVSCALNQQTGEWECK